MGYTTPIPTQPVAREQHAVRDTVLGCPRKRLKLGNASRPLPWRSRGSRRSNFIRYLRTVKER